MLLGLTPRSWTASPCRKCLRTVLRALGLTGSSFPPSDTSAIPDPPRARLHVRHQRRDDGRSGASCSPAGTGSRRDVLPYDVTDENPSWTWAAGQMISTADDLTTWVRGLGDGSLLDETTQQERLDSIETVNPDDPNSPGYGYNSGKLGPMYGPHGELPGYNSFMGYDHRPS